MQCRQTQSWSISDGGAPSSTATKNKKVACVEILCLQSNKPRGGENTTSENTTI